MDRQIVYAGQQPLETHILQTNKNAMLGIGDLAAGVFGLSDAATGFAPSATSPPALSLKYAAGSLYTLQQTDAIAYSSLGTDTATVVKQGRNAGGTLTFAAPGTAGQSINYLVQAKYVEADEGVVVLPYYNSTNPSQAYAGPGNSNTSQPTSRNCKVTVSAKAGTAAATGSQTTPSPDAGYSALWVVTVANGATTLGTGNVSVPANSIINRYSLPQVGGTIGAVIAAASRTIDPTDSTLLLKAIIDVVYPIGFEMRLNADTDPNGLYPWQTWAEDTSGRVTVSLDSTQTEFNTLGKVGGEKTHALTKAEGPQHEHLLAANIAGTGSAPTNVQYIMREENSSDDKAYRLIGTNTAPTVGLTGASGNGDAHNNLQPYVVRRVWLRTA